MTEASPSRAPVEIGQVLADKYVVERVLGVGGMGVVVAAHHRFLGGRVALKFVLPELARSESVVRRFLKEAQSATQITGEHVARVTDVGTLENGAPYMVMEYLDGQDLGAVLAQRGPLPLRDVADYVLQALQAVAEAHSKGIVHRDLKPSNLFLTRRAGGAPLVKVLDFGIAKAIAQSESDSAPGGDLTRTGAMIGSPLYMSPEQIKSSKAVDGRADVWSVGVILYELLTQIHPFHGDNQGAVLASILTEEPLPIRRISPDLPESIERTIRDCLEKSIERRLPNVAAVAERLTPHGSSDARVSWSRIAQISGIWHGARDTDLSGPQSFAGTVAATTAPTPSRTVQLVPTGSDWAGTNPAVERPQRSRKVITVLGVTSFAVLAAIAGIALLARPSQPEGVSGTTATAAGVTPPPIALPPAAPSPPPVAPAAIVSPKSVESAPASAPSSSSPVAPAVPAATRLAARRPAATKAAPVTPKPPEPVATKTAPVTPKPPEPVATKTSKPKASEDLGGLIERRE